MAFYTVQDVQIIPQSVWDKLPADGEAVLTNSGKPVALLVDSSNSSPEELLRMIRQIKATASFHAMRKRAAESGFMEDARIGAEISAARSVQNVCV